VPHEGRGPRLASLRAPGERIVQLQQCHVTGPQPHLRNCLLRVVCQNARRRLAAWQTSAKWLLKCSRPVFFQLQHHDRCSSSSSLFFASFMFFHDICLSQHTTSSTIMYASSLYIGHSLAPYYMDKLNEPSSDSTLKYTSVYILSELTDISIRLSDSSLTTYLCTAASVISAKSLGDIWSETGQNGNERFFCYIL